MFFVSSYNVICKYEYDAWSNHKVYGKTNTSFTENNSLGFIGNINPIRYKGYYNIIASNVFPYGRYGQKKEGNLKIKLERDSQNQ